MCANGTARLACGSNKGNTRWRWDMSRKVHAGCVVRDWSTVSSDDDGLVMLWLPTDSNRWYSSRCTQSWLLRRFTPSNDDSKSVECVYKLPPHFCARMCGSAMNDGLGPLPGTSSTYRPGSVDCCKCFIVRASSYRNRVFILVNTRNNDTKEPRNKGTTEERNGGGNEKEKKKKKKKKEEVGCKRWVDKKKLLEGSSVGEIWVTRRLFVCLFVCLFFLESVCLRGFVVSRMRARVFLNMIVKDDAPRLARLLPSLAGWVDGGCVVDTGSRDDGDTVRVATDWVSACGVGMGTVVSAPVDEDAFEFGAQRNEALRCADACLRGVAREDEVWYLLLLDADHVWAWSSSNPASISDPLAFAEWLHAARPDLVSVVQTDGTASCANVRLVRWTADDGAGGHYVGRTHEYWVSTRPNAHAAACSLATVVDRHDGASRAHKFERDERLLLRDLAAAPGHPRWSFYLANAYFDHGDLERAIEVYETQVLTPANLRDNWVQNSAVAMLRLGQCYLQRGQPWSAVPVLLSGLELAPDRLDLHQALVEAWLTLRLPTAACHAYLGARALATPATGALLAFDRPFLPARLYTDGFHRLGLLALAHKPELVRSGAADAAVVALLNHCAGDDAFAALVKDVLPHAVRRVAARVAVFDHSRTDVVRAAERTLGVPQTFRSSSACLWPADDPREYWLLKRYVNYWITDQGEYAQAERAIVTLNVLSRVRNHDDDDGAWTVLSEEVLDVPPSASHIVGHEDVRVFPAPDRTWRFVGSARYNEALDQVGVVGGVFRGAAHPWRAAHRAPHACEKNWVFARVDDTLKLVYAWHPRLRLGDAPAADAQPGDDGCCCVAFEEEGAPTPPMFRTARGSTCFVADEQGDQWVVVHFVQEGAPGERRRYYHVLAVFDAGLRRLLRYTSPFQFEDAHIEFCLGLIVERDRLLFSYSTMDRTTRVAVLDRANVRDWCVAW